MLLYPYGVRRHGSGCEPAMGRFHFVVATDACKGDMTPLTGDQIKHKSSLDMLMGKGDVSYLSPCEDKSKPSFSSSRRAPRTTHVTVFDSPTPTCFPRTTGYLGMFSLSRMHDERMTFFFLLHRNLIAKKKKDKDARCRGPPTLGVQTP